MLNIDGSRGEGGGQMIRSSLALSMVTGAPVTIQNIRARRSKPGLQRQHLTAVNAAAEICDATLAGAQLHSQWLKFEPAQIRHGEYRWDIGTAGSATLVLQTVLPGLMLAAAPSAVTLCGGTHNPMAPPVDFLQTVFLPQLAKMGPRVELGLKRHGFYPAGGGEVVAKIHPAEQLSPHSVLDRGDLARQHATALVANLPLHIAQREVGTIKAATGWKNRCFNSDEVPANGPGNIVMIELAYDQVAELFIGFGERGVSAEKVARGVVQEMEAYTASNAPVGPHLADQLLMPMGLAAHQGAGESRFRTTEITGHTQSHAKLLEMFLNVRIEITALSESLHEVRIESR